MERFFRLALINNTLRIGRIINPNFVLSGSLNGDRFCHNNLSL